MTIGNNKGGVGKTSVACNLAAALGRAGRRVLVIDLDSQCNTTKIMLGDNYPEATGTIYDFLDVEGDGFDPKNTYIIPTRHTNVSSIVSIEEMSALDIPLGRHIPSSLTVLRDRLLLVLKSMPYSYDFIILDTPPSIGLWSTIALTASDCAIVPIDAASSNSIDGLRRFLELIDAVKESLNPQLRFLRLLANKVDMRTLVAKHIVNRIHAEFSSMCFRTLIPYATVFQQAESLSRTIFEHPSSTRATKAYRDLAAELIEIVEGVQA